MSLSFQIPTEQGSKTVNFEIGSSVIFVGANGAGKTRLAVRVEQSLGDFAHRLSAHRALSLDPQVSKISEKVALNGLRYGTRSKDASLGHRQSNRWSSKGATHLLNDFDFLMQALFADQVNKALKTHQNAVAGTLQDVILTKLEHLKLVWERLLPTRSLVLLGDDIQVISGEHQYSASDMSDGERAVFYMLGQALMAPAGSVFIVDEPELHIHPSILGKLWDEILNLRNDCSYVFITHDLEFAAHRNGHKYVIRGYKNGPIWEITDVPEDTGFDEETVTLILGSRRPILFVEGSGVSLDSAVYRACFPDWTIIPRGSCEEVIHSVVTMRRNALLTRVTCAGIVDSDDYTAEEIEAMTRQGINILPVSEIENLVLLPEVTRVIAEYDGFRGDELSTLLDCIQAEIISTTMNLVDKTVMQYCRRRVDRILKKVDLSDAKTPDDLASVYQEKTQSIDIQALAQEAKNRLLTAIETKDINTILRYVDGKGPLLAVVATRLKSMKKSSFEDWFIRVLKVDSIQGLNDVIRKNLPNVVPA